MSGERPRMVYVRADGCGVCAAKRDVAGEIADEHGLALEVVDLDTEDGERTAEALRIRQIPTLALVRGERVPFRLVGSMITPETVRHLMDTVR